MVVVNPVIREFYFKMVTQSDSLKEAINYGSAIGMSMIEVIALREEKE